MNEFLSILLSAFIGRNTEYRKMHGRSKIKKKKIKSMLQSRICRVFVYINKQQA